MALDDVKELRLQKGDSNGRNGQERNQGYHRVVR